MTYFQQFCQSITSKIRFNMNSSFSLWSLVYAIGGLSTLGRTEQQPLGALPAPLRSAVLRTASQLAPDFIQIKSEQSALMFSEGTFDRVTSWQQTVQQSKFKKDRDARAKPVSYTSAESYFRIYKLLPKPEQADEHYAERLFIEKALIPSLGLAGLSFLTPQETFQDSKGRKRRIDFVLRGSQRYAIEIEGRAFHDKDVIGSERFDDEKQRQRDLSAAGYTYIPLSFNDLRTHRAKAVLDDLVMHDALLSRVFQDKQSVTPTTAATSLHHLNTLLESFPEAFKEMQMALLELLNTWEQEGQREVTLVDYHPTLPLLPLALIDLLAVTERVAALYGKTVTLPRFTLIVQEPSYPPLYNTLLQEFIGTELDPNATLPDPLRARFDMQFNSQEVPDNALIILSRPIPVQGNHLLPHEIAVMANQARQQFGMTPPLEAQPAHFERDILDYFTRRFFNVPELKPEQVKLIQRALRQQSGLGLLPTGFGKSLVFQLFAMLVPRTSLVISPLKALMRDQIHSLHRQGIAAVEAISSNDNSAQKNKKLEGFRTHAYRLLYISPERLQIKGFAEELKASIDRTPVGALIIDEAHCVSEWGHDFRPAYLQIRRLREMLQSGAGRTIPIIGLTATASQPVRKDVLSILGLTEDNVEQLASSDRTNISLSVHPLTAPYTNKADLLAHLIQKVIPKTLKLKFTDFVPNKPQGSYKHAGVVFAMYANTHGKTTIEEGVHAISKRLQTRLLHDPSLISEHASTAPTCCPYCDSALYVSASPKELADAGLSGRFGGRCLDCGQVFTDRELSTPKNWDGTLMKRQDDFQESKFPLLVATKGYGMGIDKRNIRFVAHHALSSGLEGYYQEAGRAGRDGQHSHAALIYAPPTQECYTTHLKNAQEPPCVSEVSNLKFHKCPYGLKPICDYGRQAHFVKGSYPGVEEDVEAAMNLLPLLEKPEPFEFWRDEEIKATQMALFRLQQLGVVGDYTLEYAARRNVRFHVERLPWTQGDITEHLTRQLSGHFDLKRSSVESRVKEVEDTATNENGRRLSKTEKQETLRRALTVLITQVYERIQRMRYRMLTNELEYARGQNIASDDSGKKVCRRVIIRSIFDSVDHLPDDYNCGFCDVCVPNLNFERTSAVVAPKDANLEEITRLLPEVMSAFVPEKLAQVVDLADRYGAVIGLRAKADYQLEHDPENLSAMYLSGVLRVRRPGYEEAALLQLQSGFQQAERTGAGMETQKLFYEAACRVEPTEAFSWITELGGSFDNVEGLKWLEKEARKTFGTKSEERTRVRTVRKLRELQEANVVLDDLRTSLDDLMSMMEESA